MDSLRENINKLIQKTLTMEDPTDPRLQSQPMYDSDDNAVDYSEEILENSQQQPEKNPKIYRSSKHQLIKLSVDIRSGILPLELKFSYPN